MSNFQRTCVVFLVSMFLASTALSQRGRNDEKWKEDPYTRMDEKAMETAGYVSFEPRSFAGIPTAQIEHVLGQQVQILWAETAHFKIGAYLGNYDVVDLEPEEKKILAEDLKRLRKKIRRVSSRPSQLDPWLRLHLFAMRAEEVYQDFQKRIGVTDEDFPVIEENLAEGIIGAGPYLGMPEKFSILICERSSVLGQFYRTFLNVSEPQTLRHHIVDAGTMFFGTAIELLNPAYQNDIALQCLMTYNLVWNLCLGLKRYTHFIPWWLGDGLGQWYSRKISPRYPVTTYKRQYDSNPEMLWNWEPRVYGRVKHEVGLSGEKLMTKFKREDYDIIDSMMAWSRIDYLLQREDDGFATFMGMMKGTIPKAGQMATDDEVAARQVEAFQEAWKMSLAEFDAAWSEWVLSNYDRR